MIADREQEVVARGLEAHDGAGAATAGDERREDRLVHHRVQALHVIEQDVVIGRGAGLLEQRQDALGVLQLAGVAQGGDAGVEQGANAHALVLGAAQGHAVRHPGQLGRAHGVRAVGVALEQGVSGIGQMDVVLGPVTAVGDLDAETPEREDGKVGLGQRGLRGHALAKDPVVRASLGCQRGYINRCGGLTARTREVAFGEGGLASRWGEVVFGEGGLASRWGEVVPGCGGLGSRTRERVSERREARLR